MWIGLGFFFFVAQGFQTNPNPIFEKEKNKKDMTFIFISMWKIRLNRIGNLGIGTASIERCRHVESGFHFLLLIFIPVVGGLDLLLSNEWLGVYLFIHLFSCRWNRRSWNRFGWFLFCNLFRSVDNQSTFLSLSLLLLLSWFISLYIYFFHR